MNTESALEDVRGVDLGQIRQQRRVPVDERVRTVTFDPVRICGVLDEEGVDLVIVGGFAAVTHGSSLPTRDIDIVPARTDENLERLARALARLGAMIRTDADPVPARIDAEFLAEMPAILNLVTDESHPSAGPQPAVHVLTEPR